MAILAQHLNSQIRISQMTDKIDQNDSSKFCSYQQQQADWQNTFAVSSNITLVGGITQTNTQAQYDNGFGTAYDKEQDNWAVIYSSNRVLVKLDTQLSLRHEDYESFGGHGTGNVAFGFAINNDNRLYAKLWHSIQSA
jgi:vitamin B12 transporter